MHLSKKTMVLGASNKPNRYAYLAIQRLTAYQHEVVAIGRQAGIVAGVPILTKTVPLQNIHTVTIYLRAQWQVQYHKYILDLQPKRIIFNPGAENDLLFNTAQKQGIEVIEGCTLVMLNINLY